MTDRLIVVESPAPVRAIAVTDDDGALQVIVQVGDRSIGVHSDAGTTATDLLGVGDQRWLPNTYEPPAEDWDDIINKPTDLATHGDVSAAIAAVVNSSPASLDTLNELASALGDDANFSATVNTALGLRATTAALATEAATRASADATLQTNITAEASTRSAADVGLQANIDAEATTRGAADTTLQGYITAEASTRSAADIALQANIDAEATARASAISTEVTARNTAIAAEATARTTAITAAVAALVNSAPGALDTLNELATALGNDANFAATMTSALALKAPLASPALTGTPTATTAAAGNNSTRIATTAYADAATAAEAVLRAAADALLAPIASPAFTGHPTGVTELASDNSTRLASTAFVTAALAALTPSWSSISSKPTTIAGISSGVATDFNTLGDARWLKQTGGTIYNGADGAATIALNIGAASTQRNALKVWGNIFIGQNNDKIIDSSNSGFLHLGSSGGTTIGYAAGTVILKAVTAGVTLSAPLIIPTGAAPASAGAAGVAGQHAWDSGFLYICTATNTWKRVAVATF